MLRILGRTSSINVRKVLWTADEIGAPYLHEDRWATETAPARSPEFIRLNPNVLVPVIVDGATTLWESNTICRYLAGKAARYDLLPQTPPDRARVEMWMDWQATELNEAWRYAFMGLVRRHPDFADPAQISASAERWNDKMRILARQIQATGAYVTGASFTLADIVLALSAHRWRSTPLEHSQEPAIADWLARLESRPAFRRFSIPATP